MRLNISSILLGNYSTFKVKHLGYYSAITLHLDVIVSSAYQMTQPSDEKGAAVVV